jgi:MscS family membrane protein
VVIFNFFIKALLRRLHLRFHRQHKPWQDSFVSAVYKPLSYYIWIIAIINAANIINENLMGHSFFESLHTLLSMTGVLAFAWFLLRWKKNVVAFMSEKSRKNEITLDAGKVDVIGKLTTIIIIFITILLLLEASNRSMNTLIAFGGVGGLAIAIASQEIIGNFFGGFMIYLNQPFVVGDWILLTDSKIEGYVEDIGWYMTRIRTFDKRPVYVPNSIFSKSVVMNPSRMSHRQIKETIGLRNRDMPALRAIILNIRKMLQDHDDIDQELRIIVSFANFGPYSLEILIDAYAKTLDSENFAYVKEDVLLKIADILVQHGADMAYPTTVIEIPDGIALKK